MTQLTNTFSALGDDIRFAIVERLLNEGELSAGELQQVADVSAPAISRHLKVLRRAGVIRQRVDRQRRLYTVEKDAVQSIRDWIEKHRKFWNTSLDRLEEALKSRKTDGRTDD